MSSNSMADINSFFINPSTEPVPGTFSQLYLLRRDISTCFGIDPNNGQHLSTQALWPGVMAICAGIDLLGKFLEGNDKQREGGKRFRNFLKTYFCKMEGQIFNLYISEILGITLLFNLKLLLTHANHAFPAMPDGRDGSSVPNYKP